MANPTGRFQGVIFDMDGVLCDSEPIICAAASQMFAESYNRRVQPEDFKPGVGAGEDRYLGVVAEKYGIKLNLVRDKKRTYAIYLQMIQGKLKPLAGVHDFINTCRQAGWRLAVASSADRIKVDGNLNQIGLPPGEFHALVCGSDVAHKKPAPDIFLTAASRLGLEPRHCLVVEDAPNGVAAGQAAGACVLALTTSFPAAELAAAGATWTAPDLTQVPPELWV